MKLSDRCKRCFEPQVRSRGENYYLSGLVTIHQADSAGVEAEVQGAAIDAYEVSFSIESESRNLLLADCDCPYAAGGSLCKHIWAVMRSVDCGEVGLGSTDRSPLRVELGDDDLDEDDPDYEWYDSGDGNWYDDWSDESSRSPFLSPGRQLADLGQRDAAGLWRRHLAGIRQRTQSRDDLPQIWARTAGKRREAWYVLNVESSVRSGALVIELFYRETKKDGQLGKPRPLRRTPSAVDALTFEEDRRALARLDDDSSTMQFTTSYRPYGSQFGHTNEAVVSEGMYGRLLPGLCATGRFRWRFSEGEAPEKARPLVWDDGPAYRMRVDMRADAGKQQWTLRGILHRGDETVDLKEPVLVLKSGIVLFRDRIARLDAAEVFPWIVVLRKTEDFAVPFEDRLEFLREVHSAEVRPEFDFPDEFRLEEAQGQPQPILRIHKPKQTFPSRELYADLRFDYDGNLVPITDPRSQIVSEEKELLLTRDRAREMALLTRLSAWHMRPQEGRYFTPKADFTFLARRLDEIVVALTAEGWIVEAEGMRVRRPGSFSGSVTSGVDWFELEGQFDYGDDLVAQLPALLRAVQDGQSYVVLSDGSRGMLPKEWLARFGPLADLAEAKDDKLHFANSQAVLLDALLAAQENVDVDLTFANLRKKLRSFAGIEPQSEPRGFAGRLRDYQRIGLGWLEFLESFQLGGCLADDMGLGKTIQVLALLQRRRVGRRTQGPSMIVVPRSLVFNWIEEAARFAPRITFRNYTGLDRAEQLEQLEAGDVLVTTYGTLRRDITKLKDIPFDFVVLDEAQAIKNPNAQVAKASRLLTARQRLALTGTPVENHLGELWSLFEFLNPGMLGRSTAFQKCWKNGQTDAQHLDLLRTALAPFILRRTKSQVLPELPEKTEQTLYCELSKQERKEYDQLRKYYRDVLQKKIEVRGLKQSKIQVLEALLRLRQAACHRGLLDKRHVDGTSAKLETLLEQVAEIVDGGHKALVFSQFTSLLSIVRKHLDQRGLVYEYLDGQTRRRHEKVRRFQEDPNCPLFLISLKAGGHGLNLTAAEYVFILDPWWNPAVESQAIDRAHRIGQERRVFAYRLIAQDTVEEKILQLQATKRNLAEAIVQADGSLIQKLTADDLQLLLS